VLPVRVWFPADAAWYEGVALENIGPLCVVRFASGRSSWVVTASAEPLPGWPEWALMSGEANLQAARAGLHVFSVRALHDSSWHDAVLVQAEVDRCLTSITMTH